MRVRIIKRDPLNVLAQKDLADTASAYSPDFALCDFFRFGYIKQNSLNRTPLTSRA
jgi:hypothetical protein